MTMAKNRARILVAADHTLVADLCRKLVETEFEVMGTVGDGRAMVCIFDPVHARLARPKTKAERAELRDMDDPMRFRVSFTSKRIEERPAPMQINSPCEALLISAVAAAPIVMREDSLSALAIGCQSI
jgi:hypothetical protein